MSKVRSNAPLTMRSVKLAGERERKAFARKGVFIQVDHIAHDGHTLICSVFQVRRGPLVKPLDTTDMVVIAEHVLQPLFAAGYVPMITAIDWAHGEDLRNSVDRPDQYDPVGLISALREAGLPYPRLSNAKQEEVDPILAIPFWRRAFGFLS